MVSQHYTLKLYPLSPIHIGCGEDYEPTNFIMQDKVLYHFNAWDLVTIFDSTDKKNLNQSLDTHNPLKEVASFIKKNSEKVIAISQHQALATDDIYEKYENTITDYKSDNKNHIQRTYYHPHQQTAIIPGSSLKGALRTALLNYCQEKYPQNHRFDKAKGLESALFNGSLKTDPMRLISLSDTEAKNNLTSKIIWSRNINKKNSTKETRGLSIRLEVIPEFVEAFNSQLSLTRLTHNEHTPSQQFSFGEIKKACNNFYIPLLENEISILNEQSKINHKWQSIMAQIKSAIKENDNLFLIRVGKHSSAEGITINNHRKIKIKVSKTQTDFQKEANTLWASAVNEKASSNLIPFGFLLVEVSDENNDFEETFKEITQLFSSSYLQEVSEMKETINKEKVEMQKIQKLRAEDAAKKLAEAQRKQSLSVNMQSIESILEKKLKGIDKGAGAGAGLAREIKHVCEQPDLTTEEKALLNIKELMEHLSINWKDNKTWKPLVKSLTEPS